MTVVPRRQSSKLVGGSLLNEMNPRTELVTDFRVNRHQSEQIYSGIPLSDISLTYSEDTYDKETLGESKNVGGLLKQSQGSQMKDFLVDRRPSKQDYSDLNLLDITLTHTEESDDESEVFGHIKNGSGYLEQSHSKPSAAPSPKVMDFLLDRRQNVQQVYGGAPLADIGMTQMEDSDDDTQACPFEDSYSSIPFDERSNYQNELQAPKKKSDCQPSKEDEESLIPFDEPPMPIMVRSCRTRGNVRYCKSETCDACRRPKPPVFVPSAKMHREIRALAGTRWWEKDYDEDMITRWMSVFVGWFGESSEEVKKVTKGGKSARRKKRRPPSMAEMVSSSFLCWDS